jgi:alpha-beta hydrolase superfamily lysophospholipase
MQDFTLTASDAESIACYRALPQSPKAVVQVAHGMGEHAKRYLTLASYLSEQGYALYANDHRGHGITGEQSLGYMGPDGWNRLLADAYELNRHTALAHPDIPIILLGHSMGSMMAQQYITRYGASIDALVLSGSPGFKAPSKNPIPRWILRFENNRVGPDGSSNTMQKLLFGSANKPFDTPTATGFEWLSRDPEEVTKYIEDPLCGFVISTGSLVDLYAGAAQASNPININRIPKSLPIYMFSGADDPVHGEKQDIQRMWEKYQAAGLSQMTLKWYEGGRHEMFNETNKSEVMADLASWLDDVCVKR